LARTPPDRAVGFGDVDHAPEAEELLRAMDLIASWPAVRELQERSATALAVQPGEAVLDVGCGLGNVTLDLAERVSPGGRVTGLDYSSLMVEEARRRAAQRGLAVEFCVGDAAHLDYDDGTFDVCRSERTLQWLSDPDQAVAEMARVLRAGGRVGLIDTDWSTLVVDHPDVETTARIGAGVSGNMPNPMAGRRLVGHCRAAGLEVTDVTAATAIFLEWDAEGKTVPGMMPTPRMLQMATEKGVVTAEHAAHWLDQLDRHAAEGRLFLALTMFSVTGRKPE
jgi:SAM-dependent methyltransferase